MARQPQPQLSSPEQLSSVARPVDTYSTPGQMQSGLGEALKSLSAWSPKLNEAADRLAARQRAQQEALAESKIGGMTYEQSKAAVKAGELHEFASPWFRAAFEKQHGIRAGNEARRQVEEHLATVDPTKEDPEAFAAKLTQQIGSELPQTEFARAGFNQSIAGLQDTLRGKVNADRIKQTVEVRADNAYANFLTDIEKMKEAGKTPAEILATVRESYAANRDTLGMSYDEQDEQLTKVLETLAQKPGNKDLIVELGRMDRGKAPVSAKIGPKFETLLTNAETVTQNDRKDKIQGSVAEFIIAADAGKLDTKKLDEFYGANGDILNGTWYAGLITRNQNAIEAQQAKALSAAQSVAKETYMATITPNLIDAARQGRVAELQDVTANVYGKTISIPRKELVEYAMQQGAAQIEQEGAAQNLPPEVRLQNRLAFYGAAGQVDPVAEAKVSAFLNAAGAGGDIPPAAANYLPDILAIHQAAPNMLHQLIQNDQQRKFVDTVAIGLELGLPKEEALKNAAWRRDNADALVQIPPKDIRKLTTDVANKMGHGGGNRVGLDPIIQDRLRYWADTGLSGGKLTKKVTEDMARTHAYFNGRFVDMVGTGQHASRTLPVLSDAADALYEAKPQYAKGRVSFIALDDASDRYVAVTVDGIRVPGSERTWEEMAKLHQDRNNARLRSISAKAQTKQEPGQGLDYSSLFTR